MKKMMLPVVVACIEALSFSGCKEPKKVTIDQLHAIEDSIPKLFPNAKTVHTIQNDDYNNLRLIIADPVFYNAPTDQQQVMAVRTGAMVLHVLGPDNSITKATLILTKDTRNDNEEPADAVKTDMKIDSLEKLTGGK
jgi:hypothetical protein